MSFPVVGKLWLIYVIFFVKVIFKFLTISSLESLVNQRVNPDPQGMALIPIVPFHKDFSPSGGQLEHRNLSHEL